MQNLTWIGQYQIHLNNVEIEVPKVRAKAKSTMHISGKKSRKTADELGGWEYMVVSSRQCYVVRLVSGYGKIETTAATFLTSWC